MKYTHSPSANRYRNSKTANAYLKKNMFTKRSAGSVKTAERLFGSQFPAFGASLGTGFTSATGVITKTKRALSV
jgi:hypothetical protein